MNFRPNSVLRFALTNVQDKQGIIFGSGIKKKHWDTSADLSHKYTLKKNLVKSYSNCSRYYLLLTVTNFLLAFYYLKGVEKMAASAASAASRMASVIEPFNVSERRVGIYTQP